LPAAPITKFQSPVSAAEFGVRVEDAIDHLTHCHQRIERSLVTVRNAIAALRLTDPVLRTEGAAALDYELALLQLLTELHIQDEEQSLFPRLQKNLSSNPASLSELLPKLEAEHREKQAVFPQLAACLRTLPTSGSEAEAALDRLEGLVVQLENTFQAHTTLEDEQLMPKCRQHLTPADLDAMRQEMRQRYHCK
jgi:hemerythrin-like domain-containing protein